jgi:hypothetical protein
MRIATFVMLLAIVLSACSPAPDPLSTGRPVEVDVGGYSLTIHCFGAGSPVVVLESGLGVDWS